MVKQNKGFYTKKICTSLNPFKCWIYEYYFSIKFRAHIIIFIIFTLFECFTPVKDQLIDPVSRVFTNGSGDLGSIPDRVIPNTFKMVLDTSLLNTQHYKVRLKGKVEQSRERVAPSPTLRCSSYWKGSLLVDLDIFT